MLTTIHGVSTSLADLSCLACQSRDHRILYETRDRHYGIKGNFNVVCCVECGLLSLWPIPSASELAALYPQTYYAYQSHEVERAWEAIMKRLLGCRIGTKDPRFDRPGRILDLGCGSGQFLAAAQRNGWDAFGVEPSADAAAVGRVKYGLNIFPGDLVAAHFPDASFDYVRSNHSFEHIHNPDQVLCEIHRILKPEGLGLIAVPNVASLNAWLFKKYWWYLGAPLHTYGYSPRTLGRLLERNRLEIVRLRFNSDFSGILGSWQIFLNRNGDRRSDEGAAFHNRLLHVLSQWTAKCLDFCHIGDVIEITFRKR